MVFEPANVIGVNLLSTAVQINDLTFEGNLDFQIGLSWPKKSYSKNRLRIENKIYNKKKFWNCQENKTFYLDKETK